MIANRFFIVGICLISYVIGGMSYRGFLSQMIGTRVIPSSTSTVTRVNRSSASSSPSPSSTTALSAQSFSLFKSISKRSSSVIKTELLSLVRKVKKTSTETPEDRDKIIQLFNELESSYGQKNTLSNPDLNAVWSLEYTTSPTISPKKGFPRVGPTLQTINAKALTAENREVLRIWNLFNIEQKVTAVLVPRSPTEVNVQFKQFTIGPISFPAPSTAKGTLDTTYLDKELRLSRGNKGNIFVLTRFQELQ